MTGRQASALRGPAEAPWGERLQARLGGGNAVAMAVEAVMYEMFCK